MRPTVVIGASLTGLLTAYRLQEQGQDVLLLEAQQQVGGVIQTHTGRGFVFERGPLFAPNSLPLIQLLHELKLSDATLISPAHSPTYLLHKHQLVSFPSSIRQLMSTPVLSPRQRFRTLIPTNSQHESSVSVFSFMKGRFGVGFTERFLQALIGSPIGANLQHLEMRSTLPKLCRRSSPSLWKTVLSQHQGAKISFVGGLQTLVRSLASKIRHIYLNEAATSVSRTNPGFKVHTSKGSYDAKRVISTCSAERTQRLILGSPLNGDSLSPLIAVYLAYPKDQVPKTSGSGWVGSTQTDVLSCSWVSHLFKEHAPNSAVLYRVLLGGLRSPRTTQRSDEELISQAHSALTKVQHIQVPPMVTSVSRFNVPVYHRGHFAALQATRQTGLEVGGRHWTGGSVAHCVQAAEHLATV